MNDEFSRIFLQELSSFPGDTPGFIYNYCFLYMTWLYSLAQTITLQSENIAMVIIDGGGRGQSQVSCPKRLTIPIT